jgi:hypothetical protein
MNTDEIIKLTQQAIVDLIKSRQEKNDSFAGRERRRIARWPFPGTVEIHPPEGTPGQWFATCRDISESGLGMIGEQWFEPESVIGIAIHLPEATLYGRGIVRYCQQTRDGYMTGIEFDFSE